MMIDSKTYRVPPGKKLDLNKWPTSEPGLTKSKKQYQKLLEEHVKDLSALQQLHYAANRHSLLLIFQGMDASGKDGAIRHVMSGINPQGCEVFSFKQPSAEELEHDFLWRTACRLPERGRWLTIAVCELPHEPMPVGGAARRIGAAATGDRAGLG